MSKRSLTAWRNSSHSGYTVVMGMGKTGVACAQFLTQNKTNVVIMDNRNIPPGLNSLRASIPELTYLTGRFGAEQLAQAAEIIISPGISLQEPALALAQAAGVPIISEIELFARYVNAPVIAITGSNGKSTVTTLVGEMAKQAGWRVQVGGNLGKPAIELLCYPAPHLYVLELSSFQLETTYSLNPKAAVVLNISADHMDRYSSLDEYIATKQLVYRGDGIVVINADDPHVMAMLPPHRQHLSFSLRHYRGDFRVCQYNHELHLIRVNETTFIPLLAVQAMKLPGAMMQANALAALALAEAVGLPRSACLDVLQSFTGLPHRCAWVANKRGVDWYNDSKGTNVGATIAAIQNFDKPRQIILIAGGESKEANFIPLVEVISQHCRACVLIGRDAPLIASAIKEAVPVYYAQSMAAAVTQAAILANPGDTVLLSPACASFDMFNNYEHRGQVFEEAVNQLNDY